MESLERNILVLLGICFVLQQQIMGKIPLISSVLTYSSKSHDNNYTSSESMSSFLILLMYLQCLKLKLPLIFINTAQTSTTKGIPFPTDIYCKNGNWVSVFNSLTCSCEEESCGIHGTMGL